MHPQKSHWDIKILKISKLHISNLLIVAFFPILILFPWYTCSSVEGAVYSEHLSLYWVHLVKCQGWPYQIKRVISHACVNIFTHDFGQQRVVYIHKKILHINLLFNSFWSTDHRPDCMTIQLYSQLTLLFTALAGQKPWIHFFLSESTQTPWIYLPVQKIRKNYIVTYNDMTQHYNSKHYVIWYTLFETLLIFR